MGCTWHPKGRLHELVLQAPLHHRTERNLKILNSSPAFKAFVKIGGDTFSWEDLLQIYSIKYSDLLCALFHPSLPRRCEGPEALRVTVGTKVAGRDQSDCPLCLATCMNICALPAGFLRQEAALKRDKVCGVSYLNKMNCNCDIYNL